MPVERRISRILSLFSLVAVPTLFMLISLPSRMTVDRSGLYAVAASLAVLALLHYAVRTRFPREGKTLSGMPELLGGVLALAVISAVAGYFGGGPRSPFSGMAFFCALLAGISLDSNWSLFAWAFVSASSVLAHALSGRLGWELAIGHLAWYSVGTIVGTAIRRHLSGAENERRALSFRVDGYLEREKVKSERISAVSHELRTPLTSMQGFAEILAERNTGKDKGEEFARIINENARRMLHLVRGLLDLSRAESVAPAEKERVDLVRLAREVCDTFSLSREEVSVRLEHPGHAPWVLADPHLLRLALGNLVSNAVKFSPPGEEVRVKVYFTERYACVAVEDRGPGIPREELPFIFHSFRRGSGARQADPQGAGLGLAVVKGVVEAHGGNVRVESEPGKGSRFAIFLPISGEVPGRATPRPHDQDERGRPKGPSIVNAYAWALPLFLTAYPGLIALGGEVGSFHPVKALIPPVSSLLVLHTFARPAPGHGKASEATGLPGLYLILALWNTFAAKGPAFTFPLFLSAAAFTGWRGEERNSRSTAILAPSAYLLSSLPLVLRDPMYVATGACFLVLVSLFVYLTRREARIIREQVAHLREAAREAMERDREASRLIEAVGKGMTKPLEKIIELSEGITSGYSLERARAYGGAILEEANELSQLVEDLLELMRIEAGRACLALTAIGPEELANLLREVTQGEVLIRTESLGKAGSVTVDPDRLARALNQVIRLWPARHVKSLVVDWIEEENEVMLAIEPLEATGKKGEPLEALPRSARHRKQDPSANANDGREDEERPPGSPGSEDLGLTLASRFLKVHGGSLEMVPGKTGSGLVLRLPGVPRTGE